MRVIIPHRARMTRSGKTKQKKTKRTLVYDRDSATHTCKQLRVQLSAIYDCWTQTDRRALSHNLR